ncbi:transcriptional regulator [Methylobacterium sp. J-048]|uniref:transcriptional regulator n=1 Tax=Methylobacterium sp. J-048 TaxID=2836635 RepID=UPI0024444AFF|nr:transcriptional regulator [Methylobacterium sp. J-048]
MRAARAFLRWTAQKVADAACIGVATVRRAELQDGPLGITAANAEAIKRALEAAGVEFTHSGEPGVKLRRNDQP